MLYKQHLNPSGFTLFFLFLLQASMISSPFLLSISMWGLVFTAFWQVFLDLPGPAPAAWYAHFWAALRFSFIRLFQRRELALLALLLLLPALSGLWSADGHFWLERTRVRLPFLVLPWAFANLPRLDARQHRLVLYFQVWMMVAVCLGVGINYLLHFDEIQYGMKRGWPVPVPRNHIRFNLILATTILAGGWLWTDGFYLRRRWERAALAAALVFLFAFIHVLSVRSGLAALYAALLFSVGWYVVRSRRWAVGLVALVLLTAIPVVAYKTLPSLQMRVAYMLWDWQQYRQNVGVEYSDAGRWVSFEAGLQLWREHPWLGVGAGDLPAEVKRVVLERFPAYAGDPRLPHNQFIYVLAGTGAVGLAIFLAALLYSLFLRPYRSFYLFAVFQVVVFASFMVEYTLETAMGVAFYLFFHLWFMSCAPKNPTANIS